MNSDQRIQLIERACNAIELFGMILMFILTFAFQFIFKELPCPLCLLQRLGFFGVALGFLLNLRFGLRPSHYCVVIFSALFTSFVALRQIALHVVPGTGAYGSPIFGYHLYTWSYIISMIIVIVTTLMFGVDRQYRSGEIIVYRFPWIVHALFMTMAALLAANVILVFLQCGFAACPDNPTEYII